MRTLPSCLSGIKSSLTVRLACGCAVVGVLVIVPAFTVAQDRLKQMPGYDQYQKMSRQIPTSVQKGSLKVTWREGGKSFDYQTDGKRYRYDVAARKATEVSGASAPAPDAGDADPAAGRGGRRGQGGGGIVRGRQAASALSPDGHYKAYYRDHNLWLSDAAGVLEMPITTDGSEKNRIKYGTASWVYGEELTQRSAMWWSPDSSKIAFYRFDESGVPDFVLQVNQTKLTSTADVEAYPKPGQPNPIVSLFIYDVHKKKAVEVDVRDGKPFENSAVGHYVYHVSWSKDGELLFNRTNRRQNILEFAAANPETGKTRAIVHEEWPDSWLDNSPTVHYFKDGKRFIWVSERTGFKNFYLYNLTGELLATLTNHPFEVANIVRLDEQVGLLYYMARDGDNFMKLQLHRVKLDGTGDVRMTDPAFHHAVDLAPDGEHFIDVAETHDTPPATRLVDAQGAVIAELATTSMKRFDELGLSRVELISFKAGDGQTDLFGMLHRPSHFDPSKKYPMLVTVYAGPGHNAARETFTTPNPLTEYGFLVATFDARSASGRGKHALDAIYMKLGVVEIDDQAAGVRSLWDRPYLDKNHVGIFGTSYGGYASAMCLLRHPDAFQAACGSSSPTDWRQYDTIYTERYMWIPSENKEGYDAGSAMTYAKNLKGRLMLYYGTADNNVHPNNTMQLVKALQGAGKSFELQVGPDQGHSGISQPRMMEFFIENLGSAAAAPVASQGGNP